MEVLEGCEDSDEEVEKQAPATEAAPKGARRFSEKYSSNGQAQASAFCSLGTPCRPTNPMRGGRSLRLFSGSSRATQGSCLTVCQVALQLCGLCKRQQLLGMRTASM